MDKLNLFVIDKKNYKETKDFFMGNCFIDNNLIIGNDGYELYKKQNSFCPEEGRYIYYDGHNIKTDPFGLNQLFYYNKKKFFAISNSFLVLVKHLKKNKISLSIDDDSVFISRYHNSLLGTQPYINTLCKEIKILPTLHYINIHDNSMHIKTINLDVSTGTNYKESLLNYINLTLSRLLTIKKSNLYFNIQTEISGGLDSRVILSFIHKIYSPNEFKLIVKDPEFNSNLVKDFEISNKIIENFGLDFILDGKDKPVYSTGHNCSKLLSYDHFKMHFMGQCYTLLSGRGIVDPSKLAFTGNAGEIYKHELDPTYNYNVDLSKVNSLSSNVMRLIEREYTNFRNAVGNKSISLDMYVYLQGRLRFHYGKHNSFNENIIYLFPNIDLLKSINYNDKDTNTHHDIISILNNDLLEIPFDQDWKNPTKKYEHKNINLNYTEGNIYSDITKEKNIYNETPKLNFIDWWNDCLNDISLTYTFFNKDCYNNIINKFDKEWEDCLNTHKIVINNSNIKCWPEHIRKYWRGINIFHCLKCILEDL